jgi:hypothetical protein
MTGIGAATDHGYWRDWAKTLAEADNAIEADMK